MSVAFRGTDTTMAGWKENLNMACASVMPSQLAAEYLDMIAGTYGGHLCVGGHSKGGNLSVYASPCGAPSTQERILSVYSHDGLGFHRDFFQQDGYRNVRERISRTIPEPVVYLGHCMMLLPRFPGILLQATVYELQL